MKRIAIIGFGQIGQIHAEAITRLEGLVLAGVVDHRSGIQSPTRCADTIDELMAETSVDVVIIAVPTPLHAQVFWDLRDAWDGLVLVEKPVAMTVTDVESILQDANTRPIYHAATAPELEWLISRLPSLVQQHGVLRRIELFFSDPYGSRLTASTIYGSSWIDSGINALSVLSRIGTVDLIEGPTAHPAIDSTFDATLSIQGEWVVGKAHVITTWGVSEPSKRSRYVLDDGVEVVLDHQAVAGYVRYGNEISDLFGLCCPPGRLVRHYEQSFRRLVIDDERIFPAEEDLRLHSLVIS